MTTTTITPYRHAIELLIAAANERVDDDDAYRERSATFGHDPDDCEHSGYLLGIRAGLEIANQMLGGSGPEYLIRHQIPEPHEIDA